MERQSKETQSTPLFTTGALFALIWPMLMEQFLSITMGMADTFMVSGVGEAAVSSVSLVDSINVLVTQLFAALTGGGAIITSQYLGRRDRESAVRSAAQLYTVSMTATLTLMVVVLVLHRPILRLVFGAIDADVMRMCETYFIITAVSYPFIGLYNAGTALFRVQGNSRISMFASLVMNAINIAGNAVLIYGLKIGVLGAATATLTGRVFAAVWVYTRQQHSDNPLRITEFALLRPQKNLICRILGLGVPSGLENSMFQIGKLFVSSLVSTLGTAGHCGQRCGKHGQQYFYPAGHDHQHCNDPGSGALSGGREQKTGASLCTSAHAGGLRWAGGVQFGSVRGDSRNPPNCFRFRRPLRKAVYRLCGRSISSAFFLGNQLYTAEHPAQRRRRPFYDGSQHSEYVAVPRGLQLCAGAGLSCRIAGRLDWYVH